MLFRSAAESGDVTSGAVVLECQADAAVIVLDYVLDSPKVCAREAAAHQAGVGGVFLVVQLSADAQFVVGQLSYETITCLILIMRRVCLSLAEEQNLLACRQGGKVLQRCADGCHLVRLSLRSRHSEAQEKQRQEKVNLFHTLFIKGLINNKLVFLDFGIFRYKFSYSFLRAK